MVVEEEATADTVIMVDTEAEAATMTVSRQRDDLTYSPNGGNRGLNSVGS